jgi:hypothetical protein
MAKFVSPKGGASNNCPKLVAKPESNWHQAFASCKASFEIAGFSNRL